MLSEKRFGKHWGRILRTGLGQPFPTGVLASEGENTCGRFNPHSVLFPALRPHTSAALNARMTRMLSADLDSVRVLTRFETIRALGLSDRTWDRLEKRGETPPKTFLSENRIGYRIADLKTWLDSRREVVTA
jgi:predicted DNA-binding transcriptional regulator AlpA